jgi:lysozyme
MICMISGLDVSHHNLQVDWQAVAASGVQFAFAKASEGMNTGDDQFAANWAGMKAAGLLRGPYHFFHPAKPVQPQVDNFLRRLTDFGAGDLPPVLDLELIGNPEEWGSIAKAQRLPLAIEWLMTIQNKLNCTPIVYTSGSFVRDILGSPGDLVSYPLWVASYTTAPNPTMPAGWSDWTFWQYGEKGAVPGIGGSVDVDWFNGELADLQGLVI